METLDVNSLCYKTWENSNRFLPGWTLAKCFDLNNAAYGIGFSSSFDTAKNKATSEYIERYIFRNWCKSIRSPFTGKTQEPPLTTTGFAVHPDCEASRENSYHEYLEHLILQLVYENKLQLVSAKNDSIFPFSRLFFWMNHLNVKTYSTKNQGAGEPVFVFVTCEFKHKIFRKKYPGFLFGSAVTSSFKTSFSKALEDALRVAPIVEFKDPASLDSSITDSHLFWLSSKGRLSLENFIHSGLNGKNNLSLPKFSNLNVQTLKVFDNFLTHYFDEKQLTAFPFTEDVPLV